MIPRVNVAVQETSEGLFRATCILSNGTSIDVLRKDRELAIRDAANKAHELAGVPIITILPFCVPSWGLPWWSLPQFRQFDIDRNDEPETPPPAAVIEGQDGPVAVLLTELTGDDR